MTYRRITLSGVGTVLSPPTGCSPRGEVGVADGSRVGTARLLGVREPPVPDRPVERGPLGSGDAVGVGGAEGAGDPEAVGGAACPLTVGGARGTAGEAGPSGAAARNGSAIRTATAQDRPTPAAARNTRRRAAARRIASYRPGGGPR